MQIICVWRIADLDEMHKGAMIITPFTPPPNEYYLEIGASWRSGFNLAWCRVRALAVVTTTRSIALEATAVGTNIASANTMSPNATSLA